MYIDPFVAGVLTTVLVLAIWLIAYGLILNHKGKGKK